MTSFLPQIGTENPSNSKGRPKYSLLELSENVQNIRQEGMGKRIRSRSHDPDAGDEGKENRKRKSTTDRSKSLCQGDQIKPKARRRYVFDDSASLASRTKPEVENKNSSGQTSPKQGSADKRVSFGGSTEVYDSQTNKVVQSVSSESTRTPGHTVGVQYKIKGSERHGVRLGTMSPVHASSPKGPRRNMSPGSPKRSRSPNTPTRTRSPYSPKRHKRMNGQNNNSREWQYRGDERERQPRKEAFSPRSQSDKLSPKGSPIGSRRTHQARLEAARMRARIWAETYSDPGPPSAEKVLK